MTTTSSDGRVQVDVHQAYSSALVYVDLTAVGAPSSITLHRNGIALVTQADGGGTLVWYDHYPPAGTVTYTATAPGGITTAAAAVTIPDGGNLTWLKGRDPNLSTRVAQDYTQPVADTEHPKARGIFRAPLARYPTILEGPVGGRTTTLAVKAYTPEDRDRILALADTGPVYYQPPTAWHDPARWVSLGSPSVRYVRLVRTGGLWIISMAADEQPTPDLADVVIPGWGWEQVQAAYASWDALGGKRVSWIHLLRRGIQ